MFDCYMAWDASTALEMARTLEPYGIYWFEDALTPDDLDGLADLAPADQADPAGRGRARP